MDEDYLHDLAVDAGLLLASNMTPSSGMDASGASAAAASSSPDASFQYEYYDLNLDDLEEMERKNYMLFIVEGLVLTAVSVFGIIGTLLSIGVLIRKDVR